MRRTEESMCQTTAYVIEGDREVLLLQDVISIKPDEREKRRDPFLIRGSHEDHGRVSCP